ncbi:MAG: UDP-2,3-diacylglucosamine diphosphatase LpxI [Candidatus Susulua stagnicola]|nr:UDP-2,3-diacylglucosamine diphosphatase LpxI [Candidatus Susulua stagnicola]
MNQKLGIIAGNRSLPLILAQRIKEKNKNCEIIAFCFKGQTSKQISKYVDKCYWFSVGSLSALRKSIKEQEVHKCIMAGQINPSYIFKKKYWDQELTLLINESQDFRPHNIFNKIIFYFEKVGIEFIDSTLYLKDDLASSGTMNSLSLSQFTTKDLDFGLGAISRFVELDIGQTISVKSRAVIALESLEGTDKTIKRAYKLAGRGCIVLKFSKANQDLRFDVPVVGISTLKLLKHIKAAALILETNKVIILKKQEFLFLAKKWRIPVLGREKCSQIPQ